MVASPVWPGLTTIRTRGSFPAVTAVVGFRPDETSPVPSPAYKDIADPPGGHFQLPSLQFQLPLDMCTEYVNCNGQGNTKSVHQIIKRIVNIRQYSEEAIGRLE